jgi:antitoxin HicB
MINEYDKPTRPVFGKDAPKDLAYYLALPYTIEIIPPSADDDGYFATIKELDGCMTQADTWAELLAMIDDAKQLWLESALSHGHVIPEPQAKPILSE